MIDLGSRIRRLRKENAVTLHELAERAGLSPSLISQAERNRLSPSIATLTALAGALGVPIARFFEEDLPEEVVLRAASSTGQPWRVVLSGAMRASFTMIVCELPEKGGVAVELEGAARGDELGYVLRGKLRIGSGKDARDLNPGDAVYFREGRPRRLRRLGGRPAAILWVRAARPPA